MRTDKGYDGRRREILSAAFDILAERGYDGTTLESVAEALGCTKPALYHYFKSKDELVESLILEALRTAGGQVDAIQRGEGRASDKLRTLIRLFLDEHFGRRGYFSIMSRFADLEARIPVGAERDEIKRLGRGLMASLAKIMSQGVEEGEFREESPKALGGIVFAMLSGILIHVDAQPLAGLGKEKLMAALGEIIVKGLSR